jgi:N-acylneuraminate cytidylyltransferase
VCCIYPVTPLLRIARIEQGFELIKQGNWNFVVPCQPVKISPERQFKLTENDSIVMNQLGFSQSRTQDLPQYFHDSGQFYWGKATAWLEQVPILSITSTVLHLSPTEVVDIDTINDWQYAELLSKQGDV